VAALIMFDGHPVYC